MREGAKQGVEQLAEKERRLSRHLVRARKEMGTFALVLAGVLAVVAMLPFWEEPVMPSTARIFAGTMIFLSLVCLAGWFVRNMVVVPVLLRTTRARLEAMGRGAPLTRS